MGKKTNTENSTHRGGRCSGRAGYDPSSVGRRRFLHSMAGAGAAAFLTSERTLSGVPEVSVIAEAVPPGETLNLKTRHAAFSIDATGAFRAITWKGRNSGAACPSGPLFAKESNAHIRSFRTLLRNACMRTGHHFKIATTPTV